MTTPAHLDLDRRPRLGMVEAVWGQNKQPDHIASILRDLVAAGETALVTRVSPGKAAAVERLLRVDGHLHPAMTHHPEARCLTAPVLPPANPELGQVMVVKFWPGKRPKMPTSSSVCRTQESQLPLATPRQVASPLPMA